MRYGLVLEGGGSKGAFHIGAYKALQELKIPISGIAGTSIGALNGAMIVQGDFHKLYQIWETIRPQDIFDIDEARLNEINKLNLTWENISYFAHKVHKIIQNGGIDTSKITNLLQENIDEEKIRSSKMEFGIVTVSLSDMKPLEIMLPDIPFQKLINYLMASANFPAFKIEKIDGKFLVDGGLYNNLPLNLLDNGNYDTLIAVRTLGLGRVKKIKKTSTPIIEILPSQELPDTLEFNQIGIKKAIDLGYHDTMKVFQDLSGQKYYLKKIEENIFIDLLHQIPAVQISKLQKIFQIKSTLPQSRILFEKIIPKLVKKLDLDKSVSYQEIILKLLEIRAEACKINYFKIYDYQKFLSLLKKHPTIKSPRPYHELNELTDYCLDFLAKAIKGRG